jgi:hypothetical protein
MAAASAHIHMRIIPISGSMEAADLTASGTYNDIFRVSSDNIFRL